MVMVALTPCDERVLTVLKETHYALTVREIALILGLTKRAALCRLRRLQRKGVVDYEYKMVGDVVSTTTEWRAM